jgi:hypothetical protein
LDTKINNIAVIATTVGGPKAETRPGGSSILIIREIPLLTTGRFP